MLTAEAGAANNVNASRGIKGATYMGFMCPAAVPQADPPMPLNVGSFHVTWYVTVRGAL